MITTDQMHRSIEIPDRPQRIISLVPSQTELLYDLGLGDRVVGITKFCVHPEDWFRSKPRVGGTKRLDLQKVRDLRPDLIIGNKEENERADIEALEKEFAVWMSDVRDLPSALQMIEGIGKFTGTNTKAQEIVSGIEEAFGQLHPLEPAQKVAYFIWKKPYMVAGEDTFVNDMLRRCGLNNVFAGDGSRYPEVNENELAQAAPQLILLSSEPYPFKEQHVAEFREHCPGARVVLVDGEAFSWYGSRLLHAPDHFNSVLFP